MKPQYVVSEPYQVGKVIINKIRKLVSVYAKHGYVIIARYGVNKTTLKKILNAYIKSHT